LPELPEVETIVRQIRPEIVGRKILRARLVHADVLRGVSRSALTRGLPGRRIIGLDRRAKHAVVRLEGGTRLIVQPGMTGALLVTRAGTPTDYAVLRLSLDDGRDLVYRDVRRLGTLLLLDAGAWRRYHESLGPEPLTPGFTPRRLAASIGGSRQAIKKALMNQGLLAGVGNIYANEALFAAGIDPSKPACDLGPAAWRRLHRELRRILRSAIASQGTTVRDYRTGLGQRGRFQLELLVYGREGESCRRCGTPLTGTHCLDARITVFCHHCQR
jgi:formamidopyrimidine-DNA glycosylase